MKLYDIGETVEEGWRLTADVKRRRLSLSLNRNKNNYAAHASLRVGQSIAKEAFAPENPLSKETIEEELQLPYAVVARDTKGLCVVRQHLPDDKALVRVGIAPGVGGTIRYNIPSEIDIIAEGVLGSKEERFPIYVLLMLKGSSFEMIRTGDTCGLPSAMKFTWTGTELTRTDL